jgi:hypothetical protein
MTPALGLTVYHPDKANHGYTLFAPMTGTSAPWAFRVCLSPPLFSVSHSTELRGGAYPRPAKTA